jgi:ATP-dependent RNA helicase DDX19/DBP5
MSEAPKSSGSLADRITQPLNAATSSFTPSAPAASKESWADEVASPTVEKGEAGSLGAAQIDGAAEPLGGSQLHDTEYEVEVKLSDIQRDNKSPLHSITKFSELGMYV